MEGLIGVIIGSIITIIIFRIERKDRLKLSSQERKDKFKLVAIERRLEAHQQALKHWGALKSIIYEKDNEKRSRVIGDAANFWYENCLYLEKETRENFYKVIFLVSSYSDFLESWKYASKGPEKEKAHNDLTKTWDEIHALSSIIMREVELEPISIKEEKDATGENVNVVHARK